jgi:hypothetical protein
VDLLEAKNYMTRLTRVANGSKRDIDIPKVPTSTGQIEKTGAKGVWIPGEFIFVPSVLYLYLLMNITHVLHTSVDFVSSIYSY